MKKITIKTGLIEGKERLKLYFEYDKEIVALVKTIPGARWDPGEKCWHVATQAGPVEKLNHLFEGRLLFNEYGKTVGREDGKTGGQEEKGDADALNTKIPKGFNMNSPGFQPGVVKRAVPKKESQREDRNNNNKSGEIPIGRSGEVSFARDARSDLVPTEFIKTMKLKNYAPNTIRTYKSMMQEFLEYYRDKDPAKITEEQIRDYLLHLIEDRNVSISYQNQSINAIKFYYEQVLGRPVRTYYIQRPKKEKILPNVLSEEEVLLILNSTDNIKHKAILSLIYSAGLRRGELINMKINDIDSKRMYVIIRQGKGRKDRYSILSEKVLELLRRYAKQYKPVEWLFEGQFGGQYGASSIQHILKDAVAVSKIRKKVTVHTLRHSFATHLLERGTDIRYIQELLGHQSSKTTEIYTHMTQRGLGKIKSPLDNFDI